MNKKKAVIIIETIVIIILAVSLVTVIFKTGNSNNNQQNYCEKDYNDSSKCLLSPRVYTNLIPANSMLILNFKPLKEDVSNYINKSKLNVSVYALNLRDGASFGINSGETYEPASLNKLPIAIIIMKKVEEGKLKIDSMIPITDNERDGSSGPLYAMHVNEMSVKDLLYYMLSESDDTALWVLASQVSVEDLAHLSDYLNYYQQDINISRNDNVYQITAKSTGNLFISLYLSTALEPQDSEMILKLLTNTSFDIRKYANLPSNVTVAQKYGAYFTKEKKEFHSCGIIYVEDSRFFYCVMTQDMDREKASQVVGTVVNKLYNFILEGRKVKYLGVD
jgi:beta-lactamase class A